MKLSKHVWIAALAAGLCVTVVFAQDEGGPPPPQGGPDGPPPQGQRHHRPPPLPIVEVLDANHDGIIDSNEIANASAALKTLDKNGDGKLTPDEYLPPRPNGAPAGGPPDGHAPPVPPVVQALDASHDDVIDSNEIANASAALKTLDKNHDGKLTPDEYPPPRPNGARGDHPEGQRPPAPPPDDN